MATRKISELPPGVAAPNAVVPATNAAGTTTQKVTLGSIAALGGGQPAAHAISHAVGGVDALSPADIGAAAASHAHSIANVTGLQSALDQKQDISSLAIGGAIDVQLSGLANGDLLRYSSGKWRNEPELNIVDGGNFG